MDKMGIGALIIGLILIALGGYGVFLFLPEVIIFIEGFIGILAILVGIFLVIFGVLMIKE